jgi:hypothetical protein
MQINSAISQWHNKLKRIYLCWRTGTRDGTFESRKKNALRYDIPTTQRHLLPANKNPLRRARI